MIRTSLVRTKLEEVIPLKVPFVINVDPSAVCNFSCKFCYQSNKEVYKQVPNSSKIMSKDLFEKIIEDLGEFETKIKVLRLYAFGEPLINPRFANFVKYAKNKNCCEKIDTTTNASLLTFEKGKQIIDAGIDRINISLQGVSSEQYIKFSDFNFNFKSFVNDMEQLYKYKTNSNCKIFIKINGDILSADDKILFYEIFDHISDGCAIEHVMSCWGDFKSDIPENNEVGIFGQKIKEKQVCTFPFYSFTIHATGEASVCFLDWNKKLIFGDVNKQTVKQIWESNSLKNLQKLMLSKQRNKLPVCNSCGQPSHGQIDDIDTYATQLLEKY